MKWRFHVQLDHRLERLALGLAAMRFEKEEHRFVGLVVNVGHWYLFVGMVGCPHASHGP